MPFRLARESDVPALLELQREFYEHEEYPFDAAIAGPSMRELLSNPHFGRLWVMERDRRMAGYLVVTFGFSLEFRGRDAFVDELFVAPWARGQGLGTTAIRVAEQTCIEAGIRTLHLEVEHTNERAKALYLRRGFYDHERHLMSKHLAPRIIETERLRLRPTTADDADTLHHIAPDIRRTVEASLSDWRERGYGVWVVEERASRAPIGFTGFRSSEEDPRPELLFGFLPAHRELATEAARAALAFAWANLDCDAVWCAPADKAAVRVMEQIGMRFERRAFVISRR